MPVVCLNASHATVASGANAASDAKPVSKASELLTTAGFKRVDKPSDKYEVQRSIMHFQKQLSRAMYLLFKAHFDGDEAGVAKYKAEVLQKLEPFWNTPPASKFDWKDADWLRMKGEYIALASIVSRNRTPEAVRPAIAALCEAVSHPAVTPEEAEKAREQLALGKELLGVDVVGLVPGQGLSYNPSEKEMMDAAVLAPKTRKRLLGPPALDREPTCEDLREAREREAEARDLRRRRLEALADSDSDDDEPIQNIDYEDPQPFQDDEQ